ncbi:metallophosphoesterase [Treponema phagedenis]|uniref:metallophosphoesterase n=1 Tax=Treponema phagedenis TaxID=162 RepID=UPI0011E7214C|nr:metallophosphoesterase [Treponema phagedenis]QEK00759.1 metallophosphoesterase [Treponema phagedenis]
MKILCVSDEIDALVYNHNIRGRYADIDLIISAGDLPMEYLEFIVSSLNKPLLFVFGNHNLNEFPYYHGTSSHQLMYINKRENLDFGFGSTYIGFKIKRESELIIMGLSGSMRYNNGLCQYTEAQMFRKILRLIPRLFINKIRYGRYLDILVTHAPPLGIHDKEDLCHKGFKCFLWFMRKFKPRFLLHGHMHLYDLQEKRVTKYHETTVINVYSQYILDTEEES